MTPIEPLSMHTERSLELRAWLWFAQGFCAGAGIVAMIYIILARMP